LSQLCYNCDTIVETRTRHKGANPQGAIRDADGITYFNQCDETLINEQFGLDLVLDPLIRTILETNGVSYLQRMTLANPCTDSLNLSRFGDTNAMDDWNMMFVYFNNDTSVVPTLEALFLASYGGNTSIVYAEPDYIGHSASGSNIPADPYYDSTYAAIGHQTSLKMIGMEGADGAWEFEVGDSNITVAVVDVGVDYQRCDLGSGLGSKVIGGMDFEGHNDTTGLYDSSRKTTAGIVWGQDHGTKAASIIGAYTNNIGTDAPGCISGGLNGMAGIGGGWGPYPTITAGRGGGVKIVGYNVLSLTRAGETWSSLNMAAAIIDASRNSLFGHFGKGVDVINISGTYLDSTDSYADSTTIYSLFVRNAISVAFIQCAANIVFAKGQQLADSFNYPSSHEPASEIIAVGGSNQYKQRWSLSNWGSNVDLIAPATSDGDTTYISLALDNTGNIGDSLDNETSPMPVKDEYTWFGGTSASAPHVSGVVALVRGFLTNQFHMPFAREDPEGMLKASAFDVSTLAPPHNIDPDGPRPYIPGYNEHTRYGFLQADTLFQHARPSRNKEV
jgi:subtilisin family serine protease